MFVLICSLVIAPSLLRADSNDWYQGRKGQWVQQQNAWQFRDSGGNVYRQHGKSWGWYNGRRHGAAGDAYHDRAPGDNQTYNQYQNTH
ncbi:MAG: hypothetical protein WA217_09505 [Candidatus Binatus sp.]